MNLDTLIATESVELVDGRDAVPVDALRRVMSGPLGERAVSSADPAPLTPTQFDVVRRFALGQTGESIARDLRVSKSTVFHHRTDAINRLGATGIHDVWVKLGWLRVP